MVLFAKTHPDCQRVILIFVGVYNTNHVRKQITKDQDLNALAHYYEKQDPATRECLLALKFMILSIDEKITHVRKFQIPFFKYNDFNLGFLWVHRKKIIVGFLQDKNTFEHTGAGRRKDRMLTMELHPLDDIPVTRIKQEFKKLIAIYNKLKS